MSCRRLGLLLWALALPACAQLDLAVELCADGQWRAGGREAQRALAALPEQPLARLLAATASLRLGQRPPAQLAALQQLAASDAAPDDVRALAAYELGRVRWQTGDASAAFRLLRDAYHRAASTDLFLRSGCALRLLMNDFPDLARQDPTLVQALATCAPLWTPELRREVRPAADALPRLAARPSGWVVALYRSQIRPALGNRCSLTPSCSAYFLEAGRRHGLLAFPLLADRLVREPSVVHARAEPVRVGAQWRYADLLDDHDRWLKGKRK